MVVVRARFTAGAGDWRGLVRVIDGNGTRRALDLRVQVWNFSLPPASLPALFGVRQEWAGRFGWNVDGYIRFLSDHRVPVGSLIHGAAGWPALNSNASRLAALWEQGQRVWIIGSMPDVCPGDLASCLRDGPSTATVSALLAQMRSAQRVADRAGWPRRNQLAYIGSELKTVEMPALALVMRALRPAFPDTTVVSCGISQFVCASGLAPDGSPRDLGAACPAATDGVDILIPRSIYYTNYSRFAAAKLQSMDRAANSGGPGGPT
jgi:hypothetical protein